MLILNSGESTKLQMVIVVKESALEVQKSAGVVKAVTTEKWNLFADNSLECGNWFPIYSVD